MNQQFPFSDRFPEGGSVNSGDISIEAPVSGDLVMVGHGNLALFQLKVLGVQDATLRLNPQDPLLQMLMQMVANGKAQSNQLAAGGIKPNIVPPARRAEDFLNDAPFASPFGVPTPLTGDTAQLVGGLASFDELLQQLDQRFNGILASLSDRQQSINVSDILLQKGNLALWRFRQGALRLFAEQASLYLLAEPQDSAQPWLGAFQMAARTNLDVLRGWVLFQKYHLRIPALIDQQAFAALSQGHWQAVLDNWKGERRLSSEQTQAEQAYLNALGDRYDAQMVQAAVREAEWYFREALRRQPQQSAALVNLAALLAESALLSYIETGTPDRARLQQARLFFQQAHVSLTQRVDQDGRIALAQCLLYEAISLPPEARLEMVQWAANQTQQLQAALGPGAPGSVRWDIARRNLAWRDPSFVDWKKIEQARDILIGAGAMTALVTLAQQWLGLHAPLAQAAGIGGGGSHLMPRLPMHPGESSAGSSHVPAGGQSISHALQQAPAKAVVGHGATTARIASHGVAHGMRHVLSTVTGKIVAAIVVTTVVAASVTGVVLAHHTVGNVVKNSDFEQPVVSPAMYRTYYAGQSFANWTVASGSIDIFGKNWAAAHGVQSIDLSGYSAGEIYQDLSTSAGANYSLSFALAGDPLCGPAVKQVQVRWGNTVVATVSFDTTGHSITHMGWQYHTYQVQATNTVTRLHFASLTQSNCGPTLDDVTVTG